MQHVQQTNGLIRRLLQCHVKQRPFVGGLGDETDMKAHKAEVECTTAAFLSDLSRCNNFPLLDLALSGQVPVRQILGVHQSENEIKTVIATSSMFRQQLCKICMLSS